MNRLFYIFIIGWFFSFHLGAQVVDPPDTLNPKDINILESVTVDGDTMPNVNIEEVEIYAIPKFETKKQARKYSRLVKNVKKVYPYAKYIKHKLEEVNTQLLTFETEKEKRKYVRSVQKEMMNQFEDDVKHMTFTQGKILIKLVDRETGETSYQWLKELKGDLFAGFWQTVARIFSSNLKAEFNPNSEDVLIDQIVKMIDAGLI